ncbi:MAG: ABC transporter ATP-binding protein [Lachnospiraceae bacterium]|nr:ABC transporter ATP-binding protein [Lachnospiraceae bacterium]
MENLLEIKHLAVSYFTFGGEVQAVRDVSFSVKPGTTVALVGESGCGKSVTAKSIMGLVKKPGKIREGSEIIFEGTDVVRFSEKEWNRFRGKQCSMIFQDALVSLNPTMKIGKQIMENLDNHETGLSGREKRQMAVDVLKMTEIPDAEDCLDKYPHELSGGMRQRVMIAMALITDPKLLIADEPTTSLDVTIQNQILRLMKNLQKKLGMAILLITHDLGIVAGMADEIVVMYAGKIVEKGPCRDIFYHPRHPYTRALISSVPRLDERGGQKLRTIEGNIPDMTRPPAGCAFCDRCPHAMNICAQYMPEMKPAVNYDQGAGETDGAEGRNHRQKIGGTDGAAGTDHENKAEENRKTVHEAACWLMDERAGGNI